MTPTSMQRRIENLVTNELGYSDSQARFVKAQLSNGLEVIVSIKNNGANGLKAHLGLMDYKTRANEQTRKEALIYLWREALDSAQYSIMELTAPSIEVLNPDTPIASYRLSDQKMPQYLEKSGDEQDSILVNETRLSDMKVPILVSPLYVEDIDPNIVTVHETEEQLRKDPLENVSHREVRC